MTTVKELIEELRKFPEDMLVCTVEDESGIVHEPYPHLSTVYARNPRKDGYRQLESMRIIKSLEPIEVVEIS